MHYTHHEYLFTRDHRTPEQVRAGRIEAVVGWTFLIGFTAALLSIVKFLVG